MTERANELRQNEAVDTGTATQVDDVTTRKFVGRHQTAAEIPESEQSTNIYKYLFGDAGISLLVYKQTFR